MSLHVYSSKDTIRHGLTLMSYNDAYFNKCTMLPNTDMVAMCLREIDKAHYVSETLFESDVFVDSGHVSTINLSTGCKTALNVLLRSKEDNVCINPLECGTNAWNTILKLNEGNVLFLVNSVLIEDDVTCDIIIDDSVHCNTIGEFIDNITYIMKEC